MGLVRALLMLALMLLAQPALAAYSCSVSTGGSINFMTYDPFAPPATASSTVTLTCTHLGGGNENIAWSMTLSNGSSGNCAARTMQRTTTPVATLNYAIYQNSTTTVWGNGGCGTFPSGTLQVNNGNPVRDSSQTMSGVLPAGQIVPVGSYLDTLVLTTSF